MEFVVKGGKIHASIKRTLLYKFQSEVSEGKVYAFENMGVANNGGNYRTTKHTNKLNFQFGTKILSLASSAVVTPSIFSFVPIPEIVGGSFDSDYLVDVIGVLTGVGPEREYERDGSTTKLNVIVIESEGDKIQCTLFGSYVDELNTFLASGETANTVVAIQLAKVKTFQDKLHIQNCMNCTKIFFNPNCDEAKGLKSSITENLQSPSPFSVTQISNEPTVEPVQEFLYGTPRSTIQGLKDSTQDGVFVVVGTIKQILNPENFWYTACICNKSVYPDSKMFFCEKCNKHVLKVFPRYSIKVQLMDDTDSAVFVLFDKDASMLFNKTCAEMLEANRLSGKCLPAEIAALINCTYLFKVEVKASFNHKFEQSFRVRKVCTNDLIVKQFKAKWETEEATFIRNANENGSLSTLVGKVDGLLDGVDTNPLSKAIEPVTESNAKDKAIVVKAMEAGVGQDLMEKFTAAAVVDLEDDGNVAVLRGATSTKDVQKSTKRVSPTADKDGDDNQPIKLLKRSIKIEKI